MGSLSFYLIWFVAINIATFFVYGYDKRQSKRGGWRVSERTLHTLAIAGGCVGGWLGMFKFRHKTRHLSFKIMLALSTLLHAWLLLSALLGFSNSI